MPPSPTGRAAFRRWAQTHMEQQGWRKGRRGLARHTHPTSNEGHAELGVPGQRASPAARSFSGFPAGGVWGQGVRLLTGCFWPHVRLWVSGLLCVWSSVAPWHSASASVAWLPGPASSVAWEVPSQPGLVNQGRGISCLLPASWVGVSVEIAGGLQRDLHM